MKLTTSNKVLKIDSLPSRKFDLHDKVQVTIVDAIDGKIDILIGIITGYFYQFENLQNTSLFFFDYTGWIYFITFVEDYNNKDLYFSEMFHEYAISKIE